MIEPEVIEDVDTEPVAMADLKKHAKVDLDLDAEDSLIAGYAKAARQYCQTVTGRSIGLQTLEIAFDAFPWRGRAISLPRATPLVEVESIKYVDSAGVETELESTDFRIETRTTPGCVLPAVGKSWPSSSLAPGLSVTVRYQAGRESADEIDIIPVLMLTAHLYVNREAVVLSDAGSVQQAAVEFGIERFLAQRVSEYVF